jgi:hypothetical protein
MLKEDISWIIGIGILCVTIVVSRILSTIEAIKNGSKKFDRIVKEVSKDDFENGSTLGGEVRNEQFPGDPDGTRGSWNRNGSRPDL